MLDTDTKRRIDSCRDMLVGKLPNPQSQVEQITIALIYKFMDDMDAQAEELGGKRKFFAGEYAKYSWVKLMAPDMGGFDVLALYSEAIQKMNENTGIPPLFRDIFKNAYLPYRDPETLRSFLKEINSFNYDHSERLGDAFEYLLSVLGSQGDAGQFRTPRHIIDFMVEVVDPKKDETILDPACGTAGFLISSYKHILKHNSKDFQDKNGLEAFQEQGVPLDQVTLDSPLHYKGDLLTPDDRQRLATHIKGYDISPDMVRLSLVNLYLHGFNNPSIVEYDTLTSEDRWSEYTDIILANPPFMSPKGGIKPHKRFSIVATRSEVLFVDYIAEHLTPTGRAAIVVPEGIIFQSGTAYKQLRKMLVDSYLVAVISLPAGVFNPYSGVKTSILILDKRLSKKTDSVLFAKIENDGFNLGAQRRQIDKNDLPAAAKNIKAWMNAVRNDESFSLDGIANFQVVEKVRIAENGEWNLSGERYKYSQNSNSKYPLVKLGDVASFIRGVTFSKSDQLEYQTEDSLLVATTKAAQEFGLVYNDLYHINRNLLNDEDKLLRIGDILISTANSINLLGRTTHIKEIKIDKPISFGAFMSVIRPNNLILDGYLIHVLKSKHAFDFYVSNANTTTNISNLNISALSIFELPLPPIEIQKEIVSEIEGYQKIIDGARQVVENYKPRIQVDPDWPTVELGEIFATKSGTTPTRNNSAYFEGGHIPWVKTLDLTDRSIHNTDERITDLALEETHLQILPKGTVLIAMYGGFNQIGRTGVLEIEATHNQAMTALLPIPNVDPYFLNAVLVSSREYWKSVANSTRKDPNITKSDVLRFKMPLPSIEIQRIIVTQLDEEQQLVNANKKLIHIFEDKIKATINRVWEN
jgi:type I restriction enzyme M protein